jgi:hypothetical protein
MKYRNRRIKIEEFGRHSMVIEEEVTGRILSDLKR